MGFEVELRNVDGSTTALREGDPSVASDDLGLTFGMVAQLNHTIIAARDKQESAKFLSEVLGLPEPVPFGHFLVVPTGNGVSLDFADTDDDIAAQHYAFLITEAEFDEIFARVQERGITFWPNPWRGNEGTINHNDGGRGFYGEDPSGHYLEVLTRPYGSGE